MTGAYYWLPQRFARTSVATRDDADAYLSRLAAFAVTLDQERARIAEDAAAGVAPPDFVLATTIGQIADLRDTGAAGSSLVKGPSTRAEAAGLHDVGPAARRIFEAQIAPALDRQARALQALKAKASSEAGVWRLPRGDEWYSLGLRSNTTVATPPAEMHQLGLDTFARMSAELDGLLKAQGLSQGSVGARIQALDVDPRFQKTNDDAGRAEILAYAHLRVAKVQALLPKAFRTLPDRDMLIERAPIAIQDGAPGAEYSGPPADGSRPGVISINLKTPANCPPGVSQPCCITRATRAITCRAPSSARPAATTRRSTNPSPSIPPMLKAGRTTQSGWPVRSGPMTTIRSARSALSRRRCSAPRGSSWTPASTTSAGPAPRPRSGWSSRPASP
jgi:uncharacterized protein (DUF885 family)